MIGLFLHLVNYCKYMKKQQKWKYPNILPPWKNTPYENKISILDESNPQSQLNKSSFRGFFNLTLIFGTIFMFTKPILNFISHGYLFESYLFNTFIKDYFLCLMTWPLFFLWSFTSFFIQKLIIRGITPIFASILQHATQSGLFIFSTFIILKYQWCASHSAFVILQTCVHFMKMHSFTTVNRDYREQYLQSRKKQQQPLSHYPHNINLRQFVLFMLTPWIVYDQYPRKSTISWWYVVKKVIITGFLVLVAYLLHTEYIIPWIEQGDNISFIELILRQILPTTILLILLFYLTFQNVTNIFAEITKLAYREFYEDWWNSTNFEQFNRKWNKPVHQFLFRHVYLQLMLRWNAKKTSAQLITFIFSATLHQFLLAMIFRTIMPFFLIIIVSQVPLIYITRSMTGKTSGNFFFWTGLILGPSLIVSSYLRADSSITTFYARQI